MSTFVIRIQAMNDRLNEAHVLLEDGSFLSFFPAESHECKTVGVSTDPYCDRSSDSDNACGEHEQPQQLTHTRKRLPRSPPQQTHQQDAGNGEGEKRPRSQIEHNEQEADHPATEEDGRAARDQRERAAKKEQRAADDMHRRKQHERQKREDEEERRRSEREARQKEDKAARERQRAADIAVKNRLAAEAARREEAKAEKDRADRAAAKAKADKEAEEERVRLAIAAALKAQEELKKRVRR
jgi:hypothetical protein